MNPEIQEIVKEWLIKNGYDGLFHEECGCALDDLIPCGEPSPFCEAGYKTSCDCGEGCDFHISRAHIGRDKGLIEGCVECEAILTNKNRVTIKGFEDKCYSCYSSSKPRTICIDFDGVLSQYDGWKGEEHCGEPMPGAAVFLMKLKQDNWTIVIHTTRKKIVVDQWLEKHGLLNYIKYITNEKIPAVAYIDDRAICFLGNFASIYEQLKTFKPHWKK